MATPLPPVSPADQANAAAAAARAAADIAQQNAAHAQSIADALGHGVAAATHGAVDPTVFRLAIFVLAIFVGYYVVWSVTPALHTPLMAVTNAISSVIIVGALIAAAATSGATGSGVAKWLGLAAVVLASINIFGGFAVTQRMLAMYRKKEKRS